MHCKPVQDRTRSLCILPQEVGSVLYACGDTEKITLIMDSCHQQTGSFNYPKDAKVSEKWLKTTKDGKRWQKDGRKLCQLTSRMWKYVFN